jgi:hypothetical protein
VDLQSLYNFISPITGRILCDPDNVLVGNPQGIAIPVPSIPISILTDLEANHLWIGDTNNRPAAVPIINLSNMSNLSRGKIWIGDPSNRPIEGDPPKGKDGEDGEDGRDGAEINADTGGAVRGFFGGLLGAAIVKTRGGGAFGFIEGKPGQNGAAANSGLPLLILNSNVSFQGGRLEDIAQSPGGDFDAVSAKWVYDLLHDQVEILWENRNGF